LRWIWRATYLSLLGGIGYLAYSVYELRTPDEQFEPDPSKQNLVILGEHPEHSTIRPAIN
jgi:NADH:ubiquinone reductase (non-electrogenic)